MNEFKELDVYVEAIRYRGTGTIFTGRIVDSDGSQTGKEILVRCPSKVLYPRDEVYRGELWTVTGFTEVYRGVLQLGATSALIKRPTGENLIATIAFNPKFVGIGEKKARDLWVAFGDGLYDMLDAEEPDIPSLQEILSPAAIECLLRVWKAEYSSDLYRWMDQYHIPKAICRRLQEFYGTDARLKVEADPYRMLAFGQTWQTVDNLANRLGLVEDDPRRLHGAVAEVLYRHFAGGHTAMSTELLTRRVSSLLGGDAANSHNLACNALRHVYSEGAFIRNDDVWQATGIYLIEAFVADQLHKMLSSKDPKQKVLFKTDRQQTIRRFEEVHHPLGDEQKAAIQMALESECCVITGGAGVGKTTVLRCLYDVVEEEGGAILQMALSGRAAKRLEEISGRPAMTIAGFLTKIKQEDIKRATHAVIDEASMLDAVSTYHILRKLSNHIKLILVGDPYQLPPIGPGLTFHVLADNINIPIARLTKIYRQSGESGIPAISGAIRNGVWPQIPKYSGKADGVYCLRADPNEVASLLQEIYEDLGGVDTPDEVQILSAVKADNAYGVVGINKAFHDRYTEGENPVLVRSPTGDLRDSGFRQGERILVTENQWDQRLFNGSLGYILDAFKTPLVIDHDKYAVAKAIIDEREIQLTGEDLKWIVHGYSISVHKSQGSQFKRVIIPLCKSRLLERTLIYTAITRGIEQVVLVGDMAAAKSAVESSPHVWLRQIGFDRIMRRKFSAESPYGA